MNLRGNYLLAATMALIPGIAVAQQRSAEDAPATETTLPSASAPRALVEPARTEVSTLPPVIDPWLTPIHTAPDDPEGGAYGIWAAGPAYKVSFHDGFAFYPYLGTSWPRNLPLTWRTESITAGGEVLVGADARAVHQRADWRYEYRYGALTEAYDVLPAGVEQTFVLHSAPRHPGDIVVTGRIQTELRAEPTGARHGELRFADAAGVEILIYGAAFAFDASGRRTDVRTGFDGQRIRLVLDGAWLADASYPVTIDPLTARTTIATWGGSANGQPSYPDVARDDETNQLMVSYSRASSASDYDTWGRLRGDDFSHVALAFTDINSWSTRYNQVAFVGGASASAGSSGRWIFALQRDFTSGSCRVRAYIHDKANTTLNSGTTIFLSRTSTTHQRFPSVGGTAGFSSGANALIAFQEDDTGSSTNCANTANSAVFGVLVDCNSGSESWGTPVNLETIASLTDIDSEWPCVSKVSDGGSTSWVVVWQEYNNAISGDDWDAIAQRVESNGTLAGRSFFGPAGSSTHKVRPKVDGRGERFLASYTMHSNSGTKSSTPWGNEIQVQRGDWSETSSSPTKKSTQSIATAPSNRLTTGDGNRGIAYDNNTDSHWAVAYHTTAWDVFITRVGYNGAPVERATAYTGPGRGFSPSICYDDDNYVFQLVWATTENAPSGQPVFGASLEYFNAQAVSYGTGCAGTVRGRNAGFRHNPYAGSEFFEVQLRSGLASAPTALFASIGPASLPLGGGCFFNLDPVVLILVFSGSSDAGGNVAVPAPLPDTPLIIGNIYYQFLQFDAVGATIVTSPGLRVEVR